jgi:hypothetical protein
VTSLRVFLSLLLATLGLRLIKVSGRLMPKPPAPRVALPVPALAEVIDVYARALTVDEAAYIIRVQKWHLARGGEAGLA